MSTLIDVSHTVEHGMITYKGLPAPIISDHLSREASKAVYEPGTTFHIGKIEMVANTGTYLDSPFHRYEGGKDLSELPLSSLANLEGVLLTAKGTKQSAKGEGLLSDWERGRPRPQSSAEEQRAIHASAFEGIDVKGKAVLIHTGWDQYWRTDKYFEGTHPFLTKEAAQYLADHGAALVGIDSYNIDDTADLSRPAHSILLGAGIPIVEHMCKLDQLPDEGFRFFAVPVKVKGMGTWPVRAFAIVSEARP